MAYEDKDILKLLQNEETRRRGFEILVSQSSEQLYWQIRRIVLSHDDANDILQNTYMKAWVNIDNFRGESKLITWLSRIAINESHTFLTKQKTMQTVDIDDTESNVVNQLESDPYFSGDELQLNFQKAIQQLPEKQRMVFTMKYYKDMKYEDISEILGTSIGALKASYFHAVRKIEKYLERTN